LNESRVSFAVVEWGYKAIDEKSNYLHNNPVEEGSVFKAKQYICGSAIDYVGGKGLPDIVSI
jgi:hypothetical protein